MQAPCAQAARFPNMRRVGRVGVQFGQVNHRLHQIYLRTDETYQSNGIKAERYLARVDKWSQFGSSSYSVLKGSWLTDNIFVGEIHGAADGYAIVQQVIVGKL